MSVVNAKPGDHDTALGQAEKNKQWQRELLMERLRSHPVQQKTFAELSKAMRMSMLEKRYGLDAVEKSNLQKCLDSMQHCIKVTSRQGLVERLESLSRQLGLKFMEDPSGLFISSDMFYLEIIIDANGVLSDVKVHHECKIEQQSCSELVTCLLKGDFADFTVQLEGLSSIYQLNAEPKVKSKAFIALQAMETDLHNLFQAQGYSNDIQMLAMSSEVGAVLKRRGGHPMKVTYFISPYDLINLETKSLIPLTLDLLAEKQIGMSMTVNLEASSANKLQILPIVMLNTDQLLASAPTYAPLTPVNSTLLPATFVLRLNKPLPVLESVFKTLVPAPEEADHKSPSSILKLIVQTASNGARDTFMKGLFVSLPDQNHCYFFTENSQLKATMVSSVPFTEPSQVPKIVALLRKQALFYTLIASCVRTQGKMDMDQTTIIEVNAISLSQISVAFEHPYEEAMAMVEFDLTDVCNVSCQIYTLSTNYEHLTAKLSKVLQMSLSIPVTIRALLKMWDHEQLKMGSSSGLKEENFNLAAGPSDPGGRSSDFRDLNNVQNTRADAFNSGGCRQFFHPSGMALGGGMEEMDFSPHGTFNAVDPNAAGLLKQFKNEVKQEDFCKSPKSISVPSEHSNDSTSLGRFAAQADTTGIVATESTSFDYLINDLPFPAGSTQLADKYQKIWKDKTYLKGLAEEPPPKEKKRAKSPQDNLFKSEKKRKKKRDNSPMGPPEKVFSRQNSPIATGDARKFPAPSTSSSSPKSTSSSVPKVSPKHSPVYCSPKHLNSPNSPFGTVSPKHGSSGKPSMSTLKNVTSPRSNSPSFIPKSKEKDRNSPLSNKSSSSSSTKLKIATVKLKPIDLVAKDEEKAGAGEHGPSKSRKGSLSAVIDKLKSAQAPSIDDVFAFSAASAEPKPIEFRKSSQSGLELPKTSGSEYMIKPSPDGMKITINKTRTKDSSSSSSTKTSSSGSSKKSSSPSLSFSGVGSPKKHTGLKPGISSGPASRKSSPSQSPSGRTSSPSSSSLQVSTKHTFQKSNSSGSLSSGPSGSKSSSSSKGGHSLTKSLSTNSFNADSFRKQDGKSSFQSSKPRSGDKPKDSTDVMKILQFASPNNLAMEGFVKSLNTKFQIPKLSARNNASTPPVLSANGLVEKTPPLPDRTASEDKAQMADVPKPGPALSTNQTLPPRLVPQMRPPIAPIAHKTGMELDLTVDKEAKPQPAPSVSLHILKSPAPSPLTPLTAILPSPHSNTTNSPSINTDDELMDEALCGIGSK